MNYHFLILFFKFQEIWEVTIETDVHSDFFLIPQDRPSFTLKIRLNAQTKHDSSYQSFKTILKEKIR